MTQREYLNKMIENMNSIKAAIDLQSRFLLFLSDNLKKQEDGKKLSAVKSVSSSDARKDKEKKD